MDSSEWTKDAFSYWVSSADWPKHKLVSEDGQRLNAIHLSIWWLLKTFINRLTAIAGAIIGLLLVFYFVKIFVTTIWRHNHFVVIICFLFIRSCNFHWSACVTSFLILVEQVCCSVARLSFSAHVTYLTLKNDFLTLKLTFLYFNSKR